MIEISPIAILILLVISGIVLIVVLKRKADKDFEKWFDGVLNIAPFFGYSKEQIENFEEVDFYIHYNDELTPEQALRKFTYLHSLN